VCIVRDECFQEESRGSCTRGTRGRAESCCPSPPTATKHRHDAVREGWLASSLPVWLNNETYMKKVQPRLARITVPAIAVALDVSMPYAADIRCGPTTTPPPPLAGSRANRGCFFGRIRRSAKTGPNNKVAKIRTPPF
jgi:hypothetical protein